MFLSIPREILERRSTRAFSDENVTEESLETLISAACHAPSAGNLQPWEFIIIREQKTRVMLARAAYGQSFIADAPAVIVVCADEERSAYGYGNRGRELYCIQDTAAAIQNILLTAEANGLGTCWVGAFNESKVVELLNIPDKVRPVCILPVGYPAETPSKGSRRRQSDVIHREDWG
jgi:nitroreductase